MLDQYSLFKLNRFRLAAILLAGILMLPVSVQASEYGTVSGGNAYDIVPEVFIDSGIMPLLSNTTAPFHQVQTWIYPDTFSPVKSYAYLMDSGLAGHSHIWLACSFNYSFVNALQPGKEPRYSFDHDFYVIIAGKKYYPYAWVDSTYYFYIVDDIDADGRLGFCYEGTLSLPDVDGDSILTSYEHLTINAHVAVQVLYSTSTGATNNYLLNAILSAINVSNQTMISYFDRQYSQLSSMQANLLDRLLSMQIDNNNLLKALDQRLILFQTEMNLNYNDWISRFASFWQDVSVWFERQHNDLINLLNQTTEGYDNSAGNAENDKLSGSLGGMSDAEDAIGSGASGNLENYDPSSALNFSQSVISGLSFVTTFIN